MRVIIAGGRDCEHTLERFATLERIAAINSIHEIVSGGANGADALGERFAARWGIKLSVFDADWEQYGRVAGPMRNREMADYADAVILFRGGYGTENMRQTAKQYGLTILYDETI